MTAVENMAVWGGRVIGGIDAAKKQSISSVPDYVNASFRQVCLCVKRHYAGVPGDANGDSRLDLSDAVVALQVLIGLAPPISGQSADIDGDGRIGAPEAGYALRRVADLRPLP